jgi:hypothetical protein
VISEREPATLGVLATLAAALVDRDGQLVAPAVLAAAAVLAVSIVADAMPAVGADVLVFRQSFLATKAPLLSPVGASLESCRPTRSGRHHESALPKIGRRGNALKFNPGAVCELAGRFVPGNARRRRAAKRLATPLCVARGSPKMPNCSD